MQNSCILPPDKENAFEGALLLREVAHILESRARIEPPALLQAEGRERGSNTSATADLRPVAKQAVDFHFRLFVRHNYFLISKLGFGILLVSLSYVYCCCGFLASGAVSRTSDSENRKLTG